ncbi:MAG: hypothetical protein O3B95_05335 [Chloroflexi bacterium]|nr:hypothetical protein [Chloroflexota bacterium]
MIDIGNVAALVVMGFVFGTFSYELLRRPQKDRLHLTGMSLFGVILGEAVATSGIAGGPAVMGLHPIAAMISSFIAVYLDVAWREHKIWPWDIIRDLKQVGEPLKVFSRLKVSVGRNSADSSTDTKQSKAA